MRNLSILLFSFLLFLSSCQKQINSGSGDGNILKNQPVTASLQGNIYDQNGEPAAGVTVSVGMQTTTSNTNGQFRIINAALDKNTSVVTAEKSGYFKAYRTFSATSGTNQVVIKLMPKISVGTVSAATGGEVRLSNGSAIALRPNSIVLAASGAAFPGTVNVYAAYIDPSRNDIAETVPGSMIANDKEGNRVILASWGMLIVELESTTGEKLQIAPGQTATLTTAIPSSLRTTAPSSIPLWYMDDQTGVWKEEGTATKNGNSYIGEVRHFTPWNCDVSFPGVMISFRVKNADDLPLVHARMQMTSIGTDLSMNQYCWTDSLGQVRILLPANREVNLTLQDPCNNAIYSQSLGSFSQDKDAGVVFIPGASIVTIKGKLVGCSGEKLKNTYAVVTMNNMIHYAKGDANGIFYTNFIQCAGLQNTAQIVGIDAASLQQGTPVTVSTTNPLTDVGTITACGNSLQEYINYNIDGANYMIVDSLDAYINTTPSNSGNTNLIFGKGMVSPDRFYFSFDNVTSPGTYPVRNVGLRSYYSCPIIQPIVTLTKFPQHAGEYYEGSISFQFINVLQNQQHSLSGIFRVKRRY